jgi:hypothetical protein
MQTCRPCEDSSQGEKKLHTLHRPPWGINLRIEAGDQLPVWTVIRTQFVMRTSHPEGKWRAGWGELNVNETKPTDINAL